MNQCTGGRILDKGHHARSRVGRKHPTLEDLVGNGEATTKVFTNLVENGKSILYISHWKIGKGRG